MKKRKRGRNRREGDMESMMKNRNAQFFLIAAVVIIVVVVSIVTISNYTQKRDVVKLYDLGQELGVESQNVLDYGTYSSLNEEQMKTLMNSFIQNYVGYVGSDKNIYFIYGNKQKINVVGYQNIMPEEVCVNITEKGGTSGGSTCTPYLTLGATTEYPSTGNEIDRVVIRIGDMEYEFKLKPGENFYFVIWQNVGGEKYVINSSG